MLDTKITVGFEDIRTQLRFGLEGREALRETMNTRFAEADRKHDEQIDLLKAAIQYGRHAG